MSIEDLTELVKQLGLPLVMSIALIWDWVANRKTTTKALTELSNSNNNIAKALEIVIDTLSKHDDNAHEIKDDVKEIKMMQNSMDSKIDLIIKK